jgi:hypothetical protein
MDANIAMPSFVSTPRDRPHAASHGLEAAKTVPRPAAAKTVHKCLVESAERG